MSRPLFPLPTMAVARILSASALQSKYNGRERHVTQQTVTSALVLPNVKYAKRST
jgi:hypothetical protein